MKKHVLAFALIGLLAAAPGFAMAQTMGPNITCPACSVTIEKALSYVPGVKNTKADLKTETIIVAFDADRATVSTLASTIIEAGFPATAQTHGD